MLPINAVPVYQQLPTREPDVESNLKKAAHFMERTSHKSESSLCSQLSQRLFELLKNEMFLRIMTAIFYACTSFLIIVVNKIILTTYKFPSSQVLGIGQMLATILVLGIGKTFEFISFPGLSRSLPRKVRFWMHQFLTLTSLPHAGRSFRCLCSIWETWSLDSVGHRKSVFPCSLCCEDLAF